MEPNTKETKSKLTILYDAAVLAAAGTLSANSFTKKLGIPANPNIVEVKKTGFSDLSLPNVKAIISQEHHRIPDTQKPETSHVLSEAMFLAISAITIVTSAVNLKRLFKRQETPEVTAEQTNEFYKAVNDQKYSLALRNIGIIGIGLPVISSITRYLSFSLFPEQATNLGAGLIVGTVCGLVAHSISKLNDNKIIKSLSSKGIDKSVITQITSPFIKSSNTSLNIITHTIIQTGFWAIQAFQGWEAAVTANLSVNILGTLLLSTSIIAGCYNNKKNSSNLEDMNTIEKATTALLSRELKIDSGESKIRAYGKKEFGIDTMILSKSLPLNKLFSWSNEIRGKSAGFSSSFDFRNISDFSQNLGLLEDDFYIKRRAVSYFGISPTKIEEDFESTGRTLPSTIQEGLAGLFVAQFIPEFQEVYQKFGQVGIRMEKGIIQVIEGKGIQYLPDYEGTDKTIGVLHYVV